MIREVENGEQIEIIVAGRVAARIVRSTPRCWQSWDAVSDLFAGPDDPDLARERDLIDQSVADSWER